jgi:cell division inhibitor SulA
VTNNAQNTRNNNKPQTSSGVTELVLTSDSPEQLALLLPMIAYLSHCCTDRWITWVAPYNVDRALLESYDINTKHIRLVHCSDPEHALWVTTAAHAIGNSHTVIASPGKISDKDLMQLDLAAIKGGCRGLLLRVR